jgi:DNA ligase-4
VYVFQVCQLLRDPAIRLHEVEVSLFSPFRPMLAERCNVRTVEESMKNSQFYYVETKYDGERFQLHMENGVFKYFSRLEIM